MLSSKPYAQRAKPIVHVSDSSMNSLHQILTTLRDKDELKDYGIKRVIENSTTSEKNLILEMAVTDSSKTIKVNASQVKDDIKYSMRQVDDITLAQREKVIEQICKLAVEAAKNNPGTVFTIPPHSNESAIVTKALESALREVFKNDYQGGLKIPHNTNKAMLERNLKSKNDK
jgi:hypothetical protein